MAAPTIEEVAAWLRNCLFEGEREAAPLHDLGAAVATPGSEKRPAVESDGITAELESLNSEEAFSYHCEQCLDMRTRELYYGNSKNSVRTTENSRIADTGLWSSFYSSEEYTSDDAVIDEEEEANAEDRISVGTGDERDNVYDDFHGLSSSSSSSSATSFSTAFLSISYASGADGSTGGIILVVAGCKSCFMYFMVPKCAEACPRCSGRLLHIGGSGCF